MVNNAIASTIHDARLSTSAGTEAERNEFVRAVSTILRLVTQKDGDLSTCFDIIDESEGAIKNSSLKQILNNNHFPLEYMFRFRRSFEKTFQSSGNEVELRTSNRKRSFLYKTVGENYVVVTINNLNL